MEKQYYYMDINLETKVVVDVGISSTANHTGDSGVAGVYRVFLPKGQFNKLKKQLD